MKYFFKKMYSWCLPYVCILCGNSAANDQDLCTACLNDLPSLTHACPRCANPLPDSHTPLICGQCLKQPPPFDVTHALYFYKLPITQLILKLKFNHALLHAHILGHLLTKKICAEWYLNKPLPSMIIPVPLHPDRLKERGFNQALEIARPVAKHLALPLNYHIGQRIKHTAAQAILPARQRQKNIKNAFTVTHNLSGQHIAIIDDVITTGHTIREFASALKSAGAQQIDVWCCARPSMM